MPKDTCSQNYHERKRRSDMVKEITTGVSPYSITVRVKEITKNYRDGDFRVSASVNNQNKGIAESEYEKFRVWNLPLLGNRVEKKMESTLREALEKMARREKKLETAENAELTESKIEEMVRRVLK